MARRSFFRRMKDNTKSLTYKMVGMRVIKPAALYITDTISSMVRSFNKKTPESSFENAVILYELSEEKLAKKKRTLLINCLLFLSVGMLIFLYTCFNIKAFQLLVLVNYFLAAMVMFVFAFRMHFFRFLIEKKRLDLTYKDWFNAVFKGEI